MAQADGHGMAVPYQRVASTIGLGCTMRLGGVVFVKAAARPPHSKKCNPLPVVRV